jgi:hypothetical protein
VSVAVGFEPAATSYGAEAEPGESDPATFSGEDGFDQLTQTVLRDGVRVRLSGLDDETVARDYPGLARDDDGDYFPKEQLATRSRRILDRLAALGGGEHAEV